MPLGPKPLIRLASAAAALRPPTISATLILAAFALVGCGTGSTDEGTDAQAAAEVPQTAVAISAVPFDCVNEIVQPLTPIHTGLTYFALYTPLVEESADYHEGQPSFGPRLAERWESSEDRLSITFHLRSDVVWSDGRPLTAEDVRFTWQAQTHPDVGWAYLDLKKRIRDVEVVDPQTVRFHYTEVYPQQLYDAAQGVIMPAHVWGERPFKQWREGCDWFNERAVSSGPFLLESLQIGQRATFTRNEKYFEPGLPKLDRLVVEIMPERSNQTASLRAGNSHFIEFVDYSDAAQLQADPAITLDSFIPRNYYFVAWNNTRAPFDSPEVRRALTLGIDRQTIIDTLFYGYGRVSHSPLASDVWAYNDQIQPLPYDPGQAKEILAQQGFADTDGDGILERNGEPFRFELLTNSENSLRKHIIVMIQSQLKRVGIDVVSRTMDFRSLVEPVSNQDFDAVVAGLSIGTDLDLSYNFHSRGIGSEGLNWSALSDPEVDRLIEAANSEEDYPTRKQLFDSLQLRIHELQPVTFLYEGKRLYAVRAPLTDVEPSIISSLVNVREWRMAGKP